MFAVTKEKVLQADRDHLVLGCVPRVMCSFACLGKPEGLEGQRIFINSLIRVERTGNSSDMSALGNESAV
jgi:hypothetical protein